MNRTTSLALAVLIAGSSAALAATDAELRTLIIGTWGESEACDGDLLVFKEDGTFTSGTERGGTYAVNGGKLTGRAGDQDMPEVALRVDGDILVMVTDSGREDRLVPCNAD